MIEWFARNPVAANLLMFGIVIAGLKSAVTNIPVQEFPNNEPNRITINTEFRGATAKSAEDGITVRIEESIADIKGIDEISSRSSEGRSSITVDLLDDYDRRAALDDIKVRVDALNTLPQAAERPIVSLVEYKRPVISVAVSGELPAKELRKVAETFREDLLNTTDATNIEIQGVADYQINIEVAPETLERYNLSLRGIGQAIQAGASDVSAGNVQTRDGDILIRSDGQAYSVEEFSRIPVIRNTEGNAITLGDLATIDDGFEESRLNTQFNGQPAVMLEVFRVGNQSALKIAEQTRNHVTKFAENLPPDVSIDYWSDASLYLQSRIGAVLNSALLGGALVLILLSLFLRPAVAFWVFLGIPVSFMGAFLFLPLVGGSFNIISLFAFIVVIGIVVDDAIVTGENIYRKIRDGMQPLEASIYGTKEIATPVTFGILTTVIAFLPLSFLQGTRFSFIASQMPVVVIPVLLMSLVESKLVLPSHMSHIKLRANDSKTGRFTRFQQSISHGLESFVRNRYKPFLARAISNSGITITILLTVATVIISSMMTGHTRFATSIYVESDTVRVSLTMPESTGFDTVDSHIQHIAKQFETLRDKYTVDGESLVQNIIATSGSSRFTRQPNIGEVIVELQVTGKRVVDLTSSQVLQEARKLIGEIPGAIRLGFQARRFGGNSPINVELSGAEGADMFPAVLRIKEQLKAYPGVFDIQDNYSGGKEELELKLNKRAYALGLNLNNVATQVRDSVFGFQAQRIQRGRDELRVMVRFPIERRSSVIDLKNLPIRVSGNQGTVLLSEIADITPFESPSTLYRINRTSTLNVTADFDTNSANINLINTDLKKFTRELEAEFPNITYRYDGEVEDAKETNSHLTLGLVLVLAGIYALLAIPFKSYGQPLVVMSIIPFAMIGAIFGHIVTGQNMSVMSVFGMLALLGVVVNDSLVLVDYINKLRARGMQVLDAVIDAACTRFRAVLLTSLTTFAGLAPILFDTSRQASYLKPMATSLGIGILFATVITLIIVPINYLLARRAKHMLSNLSKKAWATWLVFWHKEDLHENLND